MLAGALRAFFLWLANRRWVARVVLRLGVARRMAFRFVAGTTLDEAVAVVRELNAAGARATLDVLGEAVTDRAMAEEAARAYVGTIERIAAEGLDANVSLKLTQMGLHHGVDACLQVMQSVVEAGDRHGVFVRVDMESSAYTDPTLRVVHRLLAAGHDVGPVLQAYLHRSRDDARPFVEQRVRTRICKGAYAEPVDIAWHDRADINRAFVALCTALLEADAHLGVATHDPDMIEAVQGVAAQREVPRDRFEFQLLYGIRRDLQEQLLADGCRLRVYVPYGTAWYPYFMRRLAERPANVMFLLRSLFGERRRRI